MTIERCFVRSATSTHNKAVPRRSVRQWLGIRTRRVGSVNSGGLVQLIRPSKTCSIQGRQWELSRVHSSGTKYLEFSGSDVGDPRVGNQIFSTSDGHVRIENDSLGKFWIRDPNWIHVKATSCSAEAKLQIEEFVISRTIYDINFRVLDARFYDETPMTMISKERVNRNSEPELQKLKLGYDDTKPSTWTSSVGMKLGMKISIETGSPEI
ncbi:unnamed protein product [Citrullus colocynthis]|uniref:Uncharacterized protein n=1 Tax=Citrullus colocynthis TaxID=252529 RepID=A0ABP0Z720_9ROSI